MQCIVIRIVGLVLIKCFFFSVLFSQPNIEFFIQDSILELNTKEMNPLIELNYSIIRHQNNDDLVEFDYLYDIIKPYCDVLGAYGLYYEITDSIGDCIGLSLYQLGSLHDFPSDKKNATINNNKSLTLDSFNFECVSIDSTLNKKAYLYLPPLYKGDYSLQLKYYLPDEPVRAYEKLYPDRYTGTAESNIIKIIVN